MKASPSFFSLACVLSIAACSSDVQDRNPAGSGGSSSGGVTTGISTGQGGGQIGTGGSGGAPVGVGGAGGGIIGVDAGLGGTGGTDTSGPDGGKACGQQNFNLQRKPAELLLVLDRSASMKDAPTGSTASTSKWNLVVPAINRVITETDTAVAWGMKAFPEGEGSECVASGVTNKIDVPMAEMNAATVTGAITVMTPEGNGTPTGEAIKQAVAYLKSLTDDNRKYILLATDGEPSCPSPSDTARTFAVQAVGEAAAAGFHVFVVGVATTKASATTALNQMALAGMEARSDPNPLATRFYLANTGDELVAAMKAITGQVSTCLFPLNFPPPVPTNIAVKVGGVMAPQDMNKVDGWDYTGPDHLAVEVYGSWCDSIKTTAANMVEIIFGCPGVIIH